MPESRDAGPPQLEPRTAAERFRLALKIGLFLGGPGSVILFILSINAEWTLERALMLSGTALVLSFVGAGVGQAVSTPRTNPVFDSLEMQHFREAHDPELAKVTALQRSAVVQHASRLATEMSALKQRAGWAYTVGLLLCIGAVVAGPLVAYKLASKHPEHWQYMLAGSALSVIALAAATALLRHDSKLQEQIAAANRELHYFQRVATGLDCAFSLQKLDDSPYRTGLEQVVQHLLTPPPSLEILQHEPADKSSDKTGNPLETAVELLKHIAKSAGKS